MDILSMVQTVLTYACTVGFTAACRYAAVLSKRITILEQQMKFNDKCYVQTSEQIEKILDVVTEISTRLTKLEVRLERNSEKNDD